MGASETVCVLALDAADYELATRWDCDNLLLDEHAELETFTHTKDVPYTPEVWATVATGVGPEDHGISGDAQDWGNPILDAASKVTQYLPRRWRRLLGRPFRSSDGSEDGIQIRTSANETLFDAGEVWLWPGIVDAPHLLEAWRWMSEASDDEITHERLRRDLIANTGQKLGWLSAMATLEVPIAGVHSHVLDTAGHIYADRPEILFEYYSIVDRMVGDLRDRCDRLVLLSDHGIQTQETNDSQVGRHSMRAMVSAQGVEGLPQTVYDVRDWLTPQLFDATGDDGGATGIGTPEEHLRDLGYL